MFRNGVGVGSTLLRRAATEGSALGLTGDSGRYGALKLQAVAQRGIFFSSWRKSALTEDGRTADTPADSYHWVSKEAQELISKAYNRHQALADTNQSFPPSLALKDLESLDTPIHYPPKDLLDRTAYRIMRFLRVFTHAFFRKKYDHHAVVLETVAAVPGIVAAMHRHLRSLRRMERDHGWINPLLEEAENERMHLLIWMQVTRPSLLERGLVMGAQGAYVLFYMGLYLTSPRASHRLVGYLEEEAHLAYTDYLKAIDAGDIPNRPAPEIAKKYYRLPDDAKIRDVVLHVRADECMHRDFNHMLSNKYQSKDLNSRPAFMGEDHRMDEVVNEEKRFYEGERKSEEKTKPMKETFEMKSE